MRITVGTTFRCSNCDAVFPEHLLNCKKCGEQATRKEPDKIKNPRDGLTPVPPAGKKIIKCLKCDTVQNNNNALYCFKCGEELHPKELVNIKECPKCYGRYDNDYEFCEYDGTKLIQKEVQEEIETDTNKNIPMTYFNVFTYILLPLFTIFCLMVLIRGGIGLTSFVLGLTPLLFAGLHNKSAWVPTLFNFYIFTSFLPIFFDYVSLRKEFSIIFGIEIPVNIEDYLVLTVIIWLIWSLPNYIYINKRKHLFVK